MCVHMGEETSSGGVSQNHRVWRLYIYKKIKGKKLNRLFKQHCVVSVGIVSDFTDQCALNALNII